MIEQKKGDGKNVQTFLELGNKVSLLLNSNDMNYKNLIPL